MDRLQTIDNMEKLINKLKEFIDHYKLRYHIGICIALKHFVYIYKIQDKALKDFIEFNLPLRHYGEMKNYSFPMLKHELTEDQDPYEIRIQFLNTLLKQLQDESTKISR